MDERLFKDSNADILLKFLNINRRNADVEVVIINDGKEEASFKCHQELLQAISPYFSSVLCF